ncbi:hypothetical protein, partial [Caballeronia pedi]|uniref:hypothetical protein n=1 Tax=Caballeronia pedi TaxID=1777141 RepID=UPI000ACC551E
MLQQCSAGQKEVALEWIEIHKLLRLADKVEHLKTEQVWIPPQSVPIYLVYQHRPAVGHLNDSFLPRIQPVDATPRICVRAEVLQMKQRP